MISGNSPKVSSRQQEPHPGLDSLLARHFNTRWMQPLHRPSVTAFEQVRGLMAGGLSELSLVLDSGCGNGESTRALSAMHPDSLVIGIDRSMRRLMKTGRKVFPCREGNIIWVRARLETFWRLALDAGWKPDHHYLLYPNPYPKPSQLKKRWHAHPVFPTLLGLGGELELRCNWQVYALEFARAMNFATGAEVKAEAFEPLTPISPHERKYAASRHRLIRLRARAALLPDFPALLTGGRQA